MKPAGRRACVEDSVRHRRHCLHGGARAAIRCVRCFDSASTRVPFGSAAFTVASLRGTEVSEWVSEGLSDRKGGTSQVDIVEY